MGVFEKTTVPWCGAKTCSLWQCHSCQECRYTWNDYRARVLGIHAVVLGQEYDVEVNLQGVAVAAPSLGEVQQYGLQADLSARIRFGEDYRAPQLQNSGSLWWWQWLLGSSCSPFPTLGEVTPRESLLVFSLGSKLCQT